MPNAYQNDVETIAPLFLSHVSIYFRAPRPPEALPPASRAVRCRSLSHEPFDRLPFLPLARRITMRRLLSGNVSRMLVAIACVAVTAQATFAQAKKPTASAPAFGMGYTDIGPTIGLGGLNGASAALR